MTVVYDTGVLIAADRNDRTVWADHRARLEQGAVPVTTAPVVAQASRGPCQAQLHRFLRGCDVQPLRADQGHPIGHLLGRVGLTDVVDAHVTLVAAEHHAVVLTGDPDDLRALASHVRPAVIVHVI